MTYGVESPNWTEGEEMKLILMERVQESIQ